MDERILLVDDDRFFREMYADLLRRERYDVDVADSAGEALNLLEKQRYALVISDMIMPDMNGLDLLLRIKRHTPSTDVIIVTGHANVESAIHALKNGARDYLVKPCNHDEFRHTVALALQQHHLLDENHELKELVHLFQLGQSIATTLDQDRLYGMVVDLLTRETGSKRSLALFVEGGSRLVLKESQGLTPDESSTLATLLRERHRQLADGDTVQFIGDLLPADHPLREKGGFENGYLFLIRSTTALQGMVFILAESAGAFEPHRQQRTITFILEQISLAIDNASRYAHMKNLLYMDDLTGLFNYRYLDIALDREIKRVDRYKTCLSLIFIDLDQFKDVNDTRGHLTGSAVLREVGGILRRAVREVDTVLRYGGDEFVIILVETNSEETEVVAERIRLWIEAEQFLASEGYDIHLTASFGYACYPDDTKSRQELLDLADQAMYRAKNSGKNRIYRTGRA